MYPLSYPSPNLYPPSYSIHLWTPILVWIDSSNRTAAAIFFLCISFRSRKFSTRFRSVFIKYGDKYRGRGGGSNWRNAILISTRWKLNRFDKICFRTFRYSRYLYRLTRLAYLIFSAALNLITNAAWAPINRGLGGRTSVRTRRICPVRLLPHSRCQLYGPPLKLCNWTGYSRCIAAF